MMFSTLIVWTVPVTVPSVGLSWQHALQTTFQLAHEVKHQDSFQICSCARQDMSLCIFSPNVRCNPQRGDCEALVHFQVHSIR